MHHVLEDMLLVSRDVSTTVILGADPTKFDAKNPITLFIIQLFIIICFTQGLGWVFKFMNQPSVIAEIIGGIILGPTAFGRIPNFTHHIFPEQSISYLNLVSTIGLILFLFVVGLEVDISVAKRNGKKSAVISFAGIALPFGLGSAVAIPVYKHYVDHDVVTFGNFLLFICVSMSITAFPVLCRILTATKLLDTKVGIIVLSAGVGNDVLGWVLLALTLALSGSGSGVTSVYILLAAVAWSILLLWPIKKGYFYLVKRSGSLEHGPTPAMMILTLLVVFASAFMTGIIGVHPIFGGFIAGLIIPHEGGFAIAITERIEDLVTMLFLPIYFVLSGLKTNLGAIDSGRDWGYVVMLCVVAFSGKFVGCAGTAKILKYSWRESGAIGLLMSCKGLVELIVLNVGLEAGIIDKKLFSMMVIVAVVLTFLTTPCTLWVYPRKYHTRGSGTEGTTPSEAEKLNKTARDTFLAGSAGGAAGGREYTTRLLVVLQKLEHLGATMFITQLLEPSQPRPSPNRLSSVAGLRSLVRDVRFADARLESETGSSPSHDSAVSTTPPAVHIDALKLIELTGRTFSVMQSAEKDQLLRTDDALQLYKQFGRLRGMDVHAHIDIVGQESFPEAVSDYATELRTELVVVPWTVLHNETEQQPSSTAGASSAATPQHPSTPFDNIFPTDGSPMYTHFIRNLFAKTTADVALFIDRGFGGATVTPPGSGQHIFFPFFGGPDDRLALRLVVQLCHHTNVTASVVRLIKPDRDTDSETGTATADDTKLKMSESAHVHQAALHSNQLTIGGNKLSDQTRVVSDIADNIAWTHYTSAQAASNDPDGAYARTVFSTFQTSTPLSCAAEHAAAALTAASGERMWHPLLVVTGRGRRAATHSHDSEIAELLAGRGHSPAVGAEVRKTVGDPATALILAGGISGQASYLVFEAGR